MITVKINDLLNSVEMLQKLSKRDFKAKLAWNISRLLRAAESEIQSFNETRYNLIKKYGEKDENGELITDDNGNCKLIGDQVDNFNNELSELINTEIELNANKIDLALIEDLDFTPADMAIIEPYIKVDEE